MTLKNLLWRVSLLLLLTGVLKAQTPALDALNEGRYDEALRLYRLQATESPESVEALLGLSKALSGLERYEEALEWVERSYRREPNSVGVLSQRAIVFSRLNRREEALADLDRAVRIAPEAAYLHVARGYLLAELERFSLSVEAHSQALLLDPSLDLAYAGRAYSRAQTGEIEEAFGDVEQALERNPNLVPAVHTYADLLFRRARFEESRAAFDRAIKLDQQDAFLWAGRGGVKAALDDQDSALDDYNQAIALDPDQPAFYSSRGNLLASLDRSQDGLQDHNRAVELGGSAIEPLVERGQYYLDWMEMPEKAIIDFDRAVSIADVPQAYLGRGEAYLELERPNLALPDINRAIELAPSVLYAYAARAQAYEQLNDMVKAEQEYRELLGRAPNFAPAHLGLGYLHLARNELVPARGRFDQTFRHAHQPDILWEAQRALASLLLVEEVEEYPKVDVDLNYRVTSDPVLMSPDLSAYDLLGLGIDELGEIPVKPEKL
jgi:tetratricopeptide (TPR) repeat protein